MDVVVLVKLALDTGQLRVSEGKVDVESTPLKVSDIDRNAVEGLLGLGRGLVAWFTWSRSLSMVPFRELQS
jgi:hypothetical protein